MLEIENIFNCTVVRSEVTGTEILGTILFIYLFLDWSRVRVSLEHKSILKEKKEKKS